MRRAWSLLLSTAILIGSVFFVNFSAFSSDTYSFTFEGVYDYTRAYEILELVNEERAAYGLDPLVLDKELQEAYDCKVPTDIVMKVFDDDLGEMNRICSRILEMYGLEEVIEDIKN